MKSELTFVHAADLHLGHRYASLPRAAAERLRADEPALLVRLVDLCRAEDCAALVLSGDVFDDVRPDADTIRLFAEMAAHLAADGVEIYVAPGNHDPLWPDSFWLSDALPSGVHVFGEKLSSVSSRRARADFFGVGFSGRSQRLPLLEEIGSGPDPERLSVLVVHGEVVSDGAVSRYHPIPKRLLESLPFDYTALGHVHEPSVAPGQPADLARAYSGCLRGRGFDEPGPRGALVVTLRKTVEHPLYTGTKPSIRLSRQIRFAPLARHVFLDLEARAGADGFDEHALLDLLGRRAEAAGTRLDDAVVRLTLAGDNGGRRPSLPYLARSLSGRCLALSLVDLSYASDDENWRHEHGLRGAFLRRSRTVENDDPRRILARDLGLEAFAGPLDLSHYFEEER